jgi:hypothetical protein
MTYKDNTPTFNTNSKVRNFGDFCNTWEEEKEKLKKVKRSYQPNSDKQNFPTNTRNEYNPVTHKITAYTEDEVEDTLDYMQKMEESKSEKADSLEDCASFKDFNKAISELKKVTKKIHSELKKGTKGEIDDYIEKKIFGRDV